MVTLTPTSLNVLITASSSSPLLVLSGRPTSSTVSRLQYCSCSAIRFSMVTILVVRLSCGLYFSLSNRNCFSSSFISFIFFLRLVRFSLYWASFLPWILTSSYNSVLFILSIFFLFPWRVVGVADISRLWIFKYLSRTQVLCPLHPNSNSELLVSILTILCVPINECPYQVKTTKR